MTMFATLKPARPSHEGIAVIFLVRVIRYHRNIIGIRYRTFIRNLLAC
jgi:hypothetical protein